MTESQVYEAAAEEYVFPLSFQQTRFWFLEQLAPATSAYHMPIVLRLRGKLRPDVLADSFQHVVDRHEALRTRYEPDSQVQVVAGTWRVPVTLVDLTGLPGDVLAAVQQKVLRRPFDLWAAPPLRVVLVRTGAEEHVLLAVVHHIACDGWSLGVLGSELSIVYSALCAGAVPDLRELPVQYGDFALWQRDRFSGDLLRAELAHWSAALAKAPAALDLPTDLPRPAEPSHEGGRVSRQLPEALVRRAEHVARSGGASLFMIVLAAYAAVLARMAGQDVVVVGTATAGRSRTEVADLVGCFIGVVPLCLDLSGDPSAAELLACARTVCRTAFAHEDLPFERLVEHVRPVRDPARPPVFQVMLNAQDTPKHPVRWPDVDVTGESPEPGVAKYDLTVDLHRTGDGAVLDLEFNADVLTAGTAARVLERVETALGWLATPAAGTPLSEVDIGSADEWVRPAPVTVPVAAPPEPAAPRDAVEALVLDHMRAVLGKPGLGVADDFFDNGGSSMSAMSLLLEVERATGYRIGIRDIFRDATAAGLADRIRSGCGPM